MAAPRKCKVHFNSLRHFKFPHGVALFGVFQAYSYLFYLLGRSPELCEDADQQGDFSGYGLRRVAKIRHFDLIGPGQGFFDQKLFRPVALRAVQAQSSAYFRARGSVGCGFAVRTRDPEIHVRIVHVPGQHNPNIGSKVGDKTRIYSIGVDLDPGSRKVGLAKRLKFSAESLLSRKVLVLALLGIFCF
mgnify:CR=1 FL=1